MEGLEQAQISFFLSVKNGPQCDNPDGNPCSSTAPPAISGPLFFPPSWKKMVNGPGSHKRHGTSTQKINISPACTSPAESAAGEGDLSVHCIYLLRTGMRCFSCRNVRPTRPFASLTILDTYRWVESECHHTTYSPPEGVESRGYTNFLHPSPLQVYWHYSWQNRTKWKEKRR